MCAGCHKCLARLHWLSFPGAAPAQDGYQKAYYVLESFEDAVRQLRAYCDSITPPDILAQYAPGKQLVEQM